MSVCRSSRQLLSRAHPLVRGGSQCTATTPVSRSFHATRRAREDKPSSSSSIPAAGSKDVAAKKESAVTPTDKAPPLRKKADITREKRLRKRAAEIKLIREQFKPLSKEQYDAMSQYYTEEQMEALKAAEEAVDLKDLEEQWGPRLDQWKVEYMDDLSRMDSLFDKRPQIDISDGPEMSVYDRHGKGADIEAILEEEKKEGRRFDIEEFQRAVETKIREDLHFNEQTLIEMLWRMEKDKELSEKTKAGLRSLHRYKGTHLESAAKNIIYRYVGPRKTDYVPGEEPVELLFDTIDRLPMDEIEKHQLLALKHWCGTPKEEALRPQLVRTINAYEHLWEQTQVSDFDQIMQNETSALPNAVKKAVIDLSGSEDFTKKSIDELVEQFETTYLEANPNTGLSTKQSQTVKSILTKAQSIRKIPETEQPTTDIPKEHRLSDSAALKVRDLHHELYAYRRYGIKLDGLFPLQGVDASLIDREAYSALAPNIPRFMDPRVRYDTVGADDRTEAAFVRLAKQSGIDVNTLRRYRVTVAVQHRVVNQTRKGKIDSQYVLAVAGNGNGLLGIGEGKSAEPEDAILAARINALRNMKPILRYEGRTIYGQLQKKVGGTTVELTTRPPGFGLRVQHLIYEIARCAGIRDLAARVGRSRNKMNAVKATVEALYGQKLPEEIALARGRKLVDVRKVYYGQTVY